jgi:hypothetical protein
MNRYCYFPCVMYISEGKVMISINGIDTEICKATEGTLILCGGPWVLINGIFHVLHDWKLVLGTPSVLISHMGSEMIMSTAKDRLLCFNASHTVGKVTYEREIKFKTVIRIRNSKKTMYVNSIYSYDIETGILVTANKMRDEGKLPLPAGAVMFYIHVFRITSDNMRCIYKNHLVITDVKWTPSPFWLILDARELTISVANSPYYYAITLQA